MKMNKFLKKVRLVSELIIGYATTPIFAVYLVSLDGAWQYVGFVLLIASFCVNTLPKQDVNDALTEFLNSKLGEQK